jgi:hypothetical protein
MNAAEHDRAWRVSDDEGMHLTLDYLQTLQLEDTYTDIILFCVRGTMLGVKSAYDNLIGDVTKFCQSKLSLNRFIPKTARVWEGNRRRFNLSSTEPNNVDVTLMCLTSHFLHSLSGFDRLRMRTFAVSNDNEQAKFSSFEKQVQHIFETTIRNFFLDNRTFSVRQCSLLLDVIALWRNHENRFRRAPFLRDPLLYPYKHNVNFREWQNMLDIGIPEWTQEQYERYRYLDYITPRQPRDQLNVRIIIQTQRWYWLARRKIAIIRLGLFYAQRECLPRGNERFTEQSQVKIPWEFGSCLEGTLLHGYEGRRWGFQVPRWTLGGFEYTFLEQRDTGEDAGFQPGLFF